jgi:predicted site-specific integrase-resolvase
MNLAASAERDGPARATAFSWFRAGLLQGPAQQVGQVIVVYFLVRESAARVRTAVAAAKESDAA